MNERLEELRQELAKETDEVIRYWQIAEAIKNIDLNTVGVRRQGQILAEIQGITRRPPRAVQKRIAKKPTEEHKESENTAISLTDSIDVLGLPKRCQQSLHRYALRRTNKPMTVGHLLSMGERDFYCVRGLGAASRKAVVDCIYRHGLHFEDKDAEDFLKG